MRLHDEFTPPPNEYYESNKRLGNLLRSHYFIMGRSSINRSSTAVLCTHPKRADVFGARREQEDVVSIHVDKVVLRRLPVRGKIVCSSTGEAPLKGEWSSRSRRWRHTTRHPALSEGLKHAHCSSGNNHIRYEGLHATVLNKPSLLGRLAVAVAAVSREGRNINNVRDPGACWL